MSCECGVSHESANPFGVATARSSAAKPSHTEGVLKFDVTESARRSPVSSESVARRDGREARRSPRHAGREAGRDRHSCSTKRLSGRHCSQRVSLRVRRAGGGFRGSRNFAVRWVSLVHCLWAATRGVVPGFLQIPLVVALCDSQITVLRSPAPRPRSSANTYARSHHNRQLDYILIKHNFFQPLCRRRSR